MGTQHLSPAERRLQASIAGLTGWANTTDRSARGRQGQSGLMAKFEREARAANPSFSDAQIRRHATTLHKLHMKRLAQKGMQARAARRAEQDRAAAEMKARRDKRGAA
jgi:hypothetical protein